MSGQTRFEVLIGAASRCDSLEPASQILAGIPSGHGICDHLSKFEKLAGLEQLLNHTLQAKLPSPMITRRQSLAIDLHRIPYSGQPTAMEGQYLYRSTAKSGTTRFFTDATLYAMRAQPRVTLAVQLSPRGKPWSLPSPTCSQRLNPGV